MNSYRKTITISADYHDRLKEIAAVLDASISLLCESLLYIDGQTLHQAVLECETDKYLPKLKVKTKRKFIVFPVVSYERLNTLSKELNLSLITLCQAATHIDPEIFMVAVEKTRRLRKETRKRNREKKPNIGNENYTNISISNDMHKKLSAFAEQQNAYITWLIEALLLVPETIIDSALSDIKDLKGKGRTKQNLKKALLNKLKDKFKEMSEIELQKMLADAEK